MSDKLTAVISVIRHGAKDDTGNLTAEGLIQAMQKGVGTNHLKGDIILFHSGVARVKDTVKSIAKHIHLENPVSGQVNLEDFHLQDYVVPSLHYLFDGKVKGELFSTWDSLPNDLESTNNRINNFVAQLNMSSEPEVYPSPEKMARNVAKIILTQIDFATLTDENFTTNFINGTHEPVISAFLYYYLQDFAPNSEVEFTELAGGQINFAEGFDIYVYQSGPELTNLEFVFRNIRHSFDVRKLRKFLRS